MKYAKRGSKRSAENWGAKEAILDSALKVFSEHGFDGATTREIATHAGFNHAMIRYYYKSKEQLWRAAVTLLFNRIDREIDYSTEFIAKLPTVDGFKEFLRRYVRYCAKHPEHARLMVQESIRGGERLHWAVDKFIRPKHKLLAPHILRLIEGGKLPNVSPMALLYIIAATSQAPFMLAAEMKAVFGVDLSSPEGIEAHADAVVAVLFGELHSSKGPSPAPKGAPAWIRRRPAKNI